MKKVILAFALILSVSCKNHDTDVPRNAADSTVVDSVKVDTTSVAKDTVK